MLVKKGANLLFILLFTSNILFGLDKPIYTRKCEYSPITLSIQDLKKIVKKIYDYQHNPLKDSLRTLNDFHIKLEIESSSGSEISISDIESITKLQLEETYNSLKFEYGYNSVDNLNISIDLTEYSRRLNVNGNNKNQVDAIYLLIDSNLREKLNLPFYIDWLPIFIKSILFLLFLLSFILPPLLFFKLKYKTPKVLLIIFNLYSLLYLFYSNTPFYNNLYGDFRLTSDSISFTEKYGGQIGFIGLLIGIIPPFTKVLISLYKRVNDEIKSNLNKENAE